MNQIRTATILCTTLGLGLCLGCVLVFCAFNDLSALKNVEHPGPVLQIEPEHSCKDLDEPDREACQILVGCVELQRRAKQARMALHCTYAPESTPQAQFPRGPPDASFEPMQQTQHPTSTTKSQENRHATHHPSTEPEPSAQ